MRIAVLAGLAAVAAAQPAFAQTYEIRKYVMENSRGYGAPGREYVVISKRPRGNVVVVEGAPRWLGYERVVIDDRRPIWDPEYIPVLK